MNGLRVGTWSVTRGIHVLTYDSAWVESPAGRPLSLSLPFTLGNEPIRGTKVAHYFDNLLPDADSIRNRLRSRFKTDSAEAFDLLRVIGRDCVGSVQLMPGDEEPSGFDRIEGEPLSERAVEEAIAASLSPARVLGQDDAADFRISLAGTQEKTALLYHRGRWRRPLGATPTTHILKLPLGLIGALQVDMKGSVENEFLCSRLMHHMGLPIAKCEILEFGSQKVLSVERFDRRLQDGGWIARLPQEDFCQALGLPSSKKYEADGGPGMHDILQVLDASLSATEDKRAFLKAQIVFWHLAATDGHAKNFSLFLERSGRFRLTPFYDVLSAWPVIGRGARAFDPKKVKLAMAVRSKSAHWKLAEIRPSNWDSTARSAGFGNSEELHHEISQSASKAVEATDRDLPAGFPAEIRDKIFDGFLRSIRSTL
ncbi:type II toxin-antitoxin system HipA family toxin [Nibricoccus sp. IMCC34717]|uniref:type II toxin-antitoxin system HipA family toxin n=1 Tax=Nibricoccus sp. IMCC34717 TaxID=3034021 RepID=UPI00384BF600